MEPQRTATAQPIALTIADDLRIAIETGALKAGESLPTLQDLILRYRCSTTTARTAISLLKQQGLIEGGRGKPPVVRPRPRRVERSSTRHQIEKNLARESEEVRRGSGVAEDDLAGSFDDFDLDARYRAVAADQDLADAFRVPEGTALLRRDYAHYDKRTGALAASSVSWLPQDLVDRNPAIADPARAAWPGGTMHQLYTVGVEVDRVVDYVTAAMPTTVQAQAWNLTDGVPLILVRRISIDVDDRVVEVTDAQYPADRTMLTFETQLTRWDSE
ncbi:GntR family transcriptional regulator [Actinokineospora sp. UTMC 2448]|uniref:GntR family transcriptional regulator n=1 Tax=Actinokineospora sp. UTMC 2448 TaxID=2268449 RepID=UPI002164D04C|nr:GntR family transcriptional regulator [Actinokineospora sp. UTMC 2448]UVS78384.1 DNA-binding transcriptional repressor MngR [Actinokineospora sp. UTMC 2448]